MDNIVKKITRPLIIGIGKKVEKKHFSKPPIFIVACPRSGTTLLLSILSAHPNIFSIKRQTYAFDKWSQEQNPVPLRLDRLYRELLFRKIKTTADRWLEKTPKHLENIDKIMRFIPEAKIIHLIRDGRDVVTSRHPHHTPDEYWVSTNRWVDYIETGLKMEKYPNVMSVKYEQIVQHYETEIKKVLAFLNEDYCQEMKHWFDHSQIKKSKHLKNRLEKIHSKVVGRWKKQEHENRVREFMNNKRAVELLNKLKYLE